MDGPLSQFDHMKVYDFLHIFHASGTFSCTISIFLAPFPNFMQFFHIISIFSHFLHRNAINYTGKKQLFLAAVFLRPTNSNDTNKILHFRNINEASMKQYRVAESLQNLFHDVARFPVMSLVLGGVVMAEVLSLYILITSWKPIPITVAVFFTLVAFDFSVVINYILNDLSRYFVASVGYIETVKRSAKGTKWSNGFLKSCPPLKFPVGDGTFFDKMSSLNIWQTCINHLVTLLLM